MSQESQEFDQSLMKAVREKKEMLEERYKEL